MVSREELKGRWNEVKGQIQERWGELTDNDLQNFNGNVNQLVGVIERKTGAQKKVIEDYLEEIVGAGVSTMERASAAAKEFAGKAQEKAREYATSAGDAACEQYEHVSERVQAGYEQASECVRRRPVESLATAFGAGLIAGVVVTMLVRRS